MLKQILRRNTRQPLAALAVLLFAAVLTVVLCHLHKSGIEEQHSFEETYASVPVLFTVTDLDGSKPGTIKGWVADLFTDRGMQPNLAPYVKELHTRVSYKGEYRCNVTDETGNIVQKSNTAQFTGITSTYVAEELTEGWGGKIYWHDGYDETILTTDEAVCLVPVSLQDQEVISATYVHTTYTSSGDAIVRKKVIDFQVVGYYEDPGNSRIYCPYAIMTTLHAYLGVSKEIEETTAVLHDNYALDELREAAALWFAKPNPAGEKTLWGRYGYTYYFYALDIDDTMLRNLENSMKNSMRLNALASAVVFALSAGAGFLTGFLVIRSRKREITLMRTMGATQVSIFTELALEQMVCITLGILIGGCYTMWQPVQNIILFGGIYFVGLTAALIVFLHKNLLVTMKEDE